MIDLGQLKSEARGMTREALEQSVAELQNYRPRSGSDFHFSKARYDTHLAELMRRERRPAKIFAIAFALLAAASMGVALAANQPVFALASWVFLIAAVLFAKDA